MKPIPGVTPRSNAIVSEIISKFLPTAEVWLFGSRAKGTYRNGSDIDLAIKNIPEGTQLWRIRDAFDDSLLPYMVDVVDYDNIRNPHLKASIDREGILLCPTI